MSMPYIEIKHRNRAVRFIVSLFMAAAVIACLVVAADNIQCALVAGNRAAAALQIIATLESAWSDRRAL